jgi:drug/metabolite transporter (DMT)-like permease
VKLGLTAKIVSVVSFSTSAVAARVTVAGLLLLPFVLFSLRGRWHSLWRARVRVLGMGVIAVAITQLAYFAAIRRIPVSTALLIEYLAPLLLVAGVAVTSRRLPRPAVLLGSALATGGLVLVIGPGALQAVDPLGLLLAFTAAVGCAGYFLIAARPADDLPPVALAGVGLLLGGAVLGLAGLVGLVPLTVTSGDVPLLGTPVPWWVPLGVVAVLGTALSYSTGIVGSRRIGARLASFVGLLEVVSAAILAWILLGESLTGLQIGGGVLILAGIAAIPPEPAATPAPAPVAA